MVKREPRFAQLRTWGVALVVIVAAWALLAQPASATAPTSGSGTFTIAFGPVTSSRTADGNTFLTVTATEVIAGAITGTATVQFSQVIHASGDSNVNGVITCACTVGGQAGTVEFRFVASGAGTAANPLEGQFVAQNGTAGLASLHLNGTFRAVGPGGTYTVRWHFDP
jgi:hypothetical protein